MHTTNCSARQLRINISFASDDKTTGHPRGLSDVSRIPVLPH